MSAFDPLRPEAGACYHCGDALPVQPVRTWLDAAERAMCCPGCAAAAAWIRDAGLDDYYRLRTASGQRIDADAGADLGAWDRQDLLASHVRTHGDEHQITLLIEGIACAACAWLIGRALPRLPGVIEADANAVTGRLHLRWRPGQVPLSAIVRQLHALGYRPHLASGEAAEQARRAERRDLLKRLAVAGLGAFQAMMLAEALYLDFHNTMELATRDFFRWFTFLVSTPVVFYAGQPFLSGMVRELRMRRFGMDTLIASSVLIAYVASLIETIRGGPHVWYDAAVMFVLFLLLARYLERMARQRAQSAVDALARAQPVLAWQERADGSRAQVPLNELAAGDIVHVRAGEAVPADGILLDTVAELDEALLTGESQPVPHTPGDTLWAGSLAVAQPLRMRVARTGQETLLSHLVHLVERAQAQRPRLAQLADRIASWFVVGLFSAAAIVAVVWSQTVPERAFEVTLAVLIVSCPCALSLALPAAIAAGHARLAGLGVLVLGDDALTRLTGIDTVIFDKTGTLTQGRLELRDTVTFDDLDADQARTIAAALEHGSSHPIGQAFAGIVAAPAQGIQVVAGQGVSGRVEGIDYRLGRPGFVAPGAEPDRDGIFLGDGRRLLARFEVADQARPDAAAAVQALSADGLAVQVLSGDSHDAVAALADSLGIGDWHARQTPEDKLAHVRELQARGHVVAMLGDGVNDAPVLAGADVSIALAAGAPLAHRSADVVLMGSQLQRLPQTLVLARRTRAIMRQNLAWALGYNVLALPFAALGLVTPLLAAVGMALSSLLVTGNALRISRDRPGKGKGKGSAVAVVDAGSPAAGVATANRNLPAQRPA
ncbi:MAG: cadmium-translocating P-type ATPase [Xanthomonadales bacterium]|nr:cadmium-translocating P-type ATPase [Xanthomonadales bacterium]